MGDLFFASQFNIKGAIITGIPTYEGTCGKVMLKLKAHFDKMKTIVFNNYVKRDIVLLNKYIFNITLIIYKFIFQNIYLCICVINGLII